MRPLRETTTVIRPPCICVTKTLRTSLPVSLSSSTKNTRLAATDSRNWPADTCEMSSRCANRCWYSLACWLAHGDTTKATSATSAAIGAAKPSTGPIHASRLWPLANQITISESRNARVSDISTAM